MISNGTPSSERAKCADQGRCRRLGVRGWRCRGRAVASRVLAGVDGRTISSRYPRGSRRPCGGSGDHLADPLARVGGGVQHGWPRGPRSSSYACTESLCAGGGGGGVAPAAAPATAGGAARHGDSAMVGRLSGGAPSGPLRAGGRRLPRGVARWSNFFYTAPTGARVSRPPVHRYHQIPAARGRTKSGLVGRHRISTNCRVRLRSRHRNHS